MRSWKWRMCVKETNFCSHTLLYSICPSMQSLSLSHTHTHTRTHTHVWAELCVIQSELLNKGRRRACGLRCTTTNLIGSNRLTPSLPGAGPHSEAPQGPSAPRAPTTPKIPLLTTYQLLFRDEAVDDFKKKIFCIECHQLVVLFWECFIIIFLLMCLNYWFPLIAAHPPASVFFSWCLSTILSHATHVLICFVSEWVFGD